MPQRIAETAKGPIEYRLEGNGPTVLVLNGGHCSRETRMTHERLAEHGFSVLTPSRPGYDSTPPAVGRSAQEAADALAALLDTLQIPIVDVIGISAGAMTALAFAQRHPTRTGKLILESPKVTDWDESIKRLARILFGPTEKATWTLMRLLLKFFPDVILKALLADLTLLDVNEVLNRMSADERAFLTRAFQSFRSGKGFMADLEHHVENLDMIQKPLLLIYSPNDKSCTEKDIQRIKQEIPTCEVYEVAADTHFIWIGKTAQDVWEKRLSFL